MAMKRVEINILDMPDGPLSREVWKQMIVDQLEVAGFDLGRDYKRYFDGYIMVFEQGD